MDVLEEEGGDGSGATVMKSYTLLLLPPSLSSLFATYYHVYWISSVAASNVCVCVRGGEGFPYTFANLDSLEMKRTKQSYQHLFLSLSRRNTRPTNIGIAGGTLSVATLVVVCDGVRQLGCSKVFISLIYHSYSVSAPGQVLE